MPRRVVMTATAVVAAVTLAKTVAETRRVIEDYRTRGYIAHSVKIGGAPEADIERIRDVEATRPPGEIILYDCNRGWSRQEALRVMQATEDLRVMFEQPCETLDDIAAIRPLHRAPVSVDESLVTLQDAARIALTTLMDELERRPSVEAVRMVLFSEEQHALHERVLAELTGAKA